MHVDRRGYSYETYRAGGKVRRRYLGSGPVWGALAQVDRLDRQHAQDEREAVQKGRARRVAEVTQASLSIQAFCDECSALLRACLSASGYHRPKRGVWRKRRLPKEHEMAKAKTTESKALASVEGAPFPTDPKEIKALYDRARSGDKDAAMMMMAHVKGKPNEAAFLQAAAPMAATARISMLVAPLEGGNELGRLSINRQLDLLRDEIAGPNASALELMLAERVVICNAEVSNLQALHGNSIRESFKTCEFFGRQLDASHRRHLEAVKALATVRKLKLPSIQVNIGDKQVNVANINGAPTST